MNLTQAYDSGEALKRWVGVCGQVMRVLLRFWLVIATDCPDTAKWQVCSHQLENILAWVITAALQFCRDQVSNPTL